MEGDLHVLWMTAPLRAVVLLNITMRSEVEAGWKPAGVAARERVAAVARTARDLGSIIVGDEWISDECVCDS